MITSLLLGLLKTLLVAFYNIMNSALSVVFSNVTSGYNTLSAYSAWNFGLGIIDLVFGIQWLLGSIGLFVTSLILMRLVKYFINFFTK